MANNPQKISRFLLCLVIVCAVVLLIMCALLTVMIIRDRQTFPPATDPAPAASETTEPAQEPTETTVASNETTQATVPDTEPAAETTEATESTEEAETTEATEPVEETTEEPTEAPEPADPDPLTVFLERGGVTFGDLEKKNCSQLIIVTADGTYADIHFYSRSSGQWTEVSSLSCSGRVGRSGVSSHKQEGDGATPTGLYSIGSGFYIHSAPDTGLDLFQITQDTYWIDDPDSQFYNQRIEGTENKDWDSAEHMIDYGTYRYGFVVDYNLTAEYNAGSAIFFHIGSSSTAGCIATSENMVLAYLAQLDKTQKPHILILDEV